MIGGEQPAAGAPAGYLIATYREIADRFGLGSPDAARVRAKRSGWEREPSNHPLDPARIKVPLSAWEQSQPERPRAPQTDRPRSPARSGEANPNTDPPNSPPGSGSVGPIFGALALLQDQLDRERQRADAAEKAAQEERQRSDLRVVEVAELRERVGRAEGERDHARAERERVEQQAARMQVELAEWAAGGPLARAMRAFLNRRGRP